MRIYLITAVFLILCSSAFADYLGSYALESTVAFTVDTYNATTGAVSDADSAPTYRVYEETTGTAVVTGTTALLDDAGTVGFYAHSFTAAAASGFEVGKTYTIRISWAVSSVTVTKLHTFQVVAALPANFASLNIDGSGRVLLQATQSGVTIPTVTTVTNMVSTSDANLVHQEEIEDYVGTVIHLASGMNEQLQLSYYYVTLTDVDGGQRVSFAKISSLESGGTQVELDRALGFVPEPGDILKVYRIPVQLYDTYSGQNTGVRISTGTGSGQLQINNGIVQSNLKQVGDSATFLTKFADFLNDAYNSTTNVVSTDATAAALAAQTAATSASTAASAASTAATSANTNAAAAKIASEAALAALTNAPSFTSLMNSHGYTTARAQTLDNLDVAVSTRVEGEDLSALATTAYVASRTLPASEYISAAKMLKYVQLMFRKDSAIVTANAAELTEINTGGGAYSPVTDSSEAQADAEAAHKAVTDKVLQLEKTR